MNVELKPDLSQDVSEYTSGGESETPPPAQAPEQSPEPSSEMQAILDLGKAEKFRFDGKEYTLKDLQDWRRDGLRYADYTKKAQALALERKQLGEKLEKDYEPYKKYSAENLIADLYRVKQNPSLAARFKEVWGDTKYHSALEMIGLESRTETPSRQAALPPEIEARMNQFMELGSRLEAREMSAMQAEIDAKFDTLMKKYPDVDDELATVKLETLANQKGALSDQDYEAVFKDLQDRFDSRAKSRQSDLFQKQKEKNQQGRDVPPGGGALGQAPRNPKNFQEAYEFAMQAIKNS